MVFEANEVRWVNKFTTTSLEVLRQVGKESRLWQSLVKKRTKVFENIICHNETANLALLGGVEGNSCKSMQIVSQIIRCRMDEVCGHENWRSELIPT